MTGREVVILGSGGHAKVVISTLRAMGQIPVAAYDDDSTRWGNSVLGVAIRGPVQEAKGAAIIAIGMNRIRQQLSKLNLEWVNAVHPSAIIDPTVTIGPGTVIFAGCVIQPDAALGSHVIINTGATIDHDDLIADFSQVGPGAHLGGNVRTGEGAFIGLGASIIQGQTVGAWSTVGAGAVVIGDVEPGHTYVGVPAKPRL